MVKNRTFSSNADPQEKSCYTEELSIAEFNKEWYVRTLNSEGCARIKAETGISPRHCLTIANNGVIFTTPWIDFETKKMYASQHVAWTDGDLARKVQAFLDNLKMFKETMASWLEIKIILEDSNDINY